MAPRRDRRASFVRYRHQSSAQPDELPLRRPLATQPLHALIRTHPRVADRGRASWRLADFEATLAPERRERFSAPSIQKLLAGIADHSSYLWRLIEADPERLERLLDQDPASSLRATLAPLRPGADGLATADEADVMCRVRRAKQTVALLVALADLGGAWRLEQVTGALSEAADAMIGAALAFLLRQARAAGKLRLGDDTDPQAGCGMAVLGVGKLGGDELNYSSDVDLIVVFDPASPALVAPDDAKTLYVRLVRDLVRLLQQPTGDGYGLRVDLRLRPDPGATAVAIGVPAAHLYYEAYGQNWERAALIKARPVAGDLALGRAFIAGLAPFIWRKYFDFAAIADIHAMKRQIQAVKGGATIAVAGHDVKIGRGGIREIEFFVQTQQLIFGGKRPALRGTRTVEMLRQLRHDRWIDARAGAELTQAYDILRRIEHRLQMLADEQTHRLPMAPDALERFARFCGFVSAARFTAVLTHHLERVVAHYGLLFEREPSLGIDDGSLAFTGVGDDPATIETLATLGYRAPEAIAATVRAWHAGARPAIRSARARETLTDLVPKLLQAFAGTQDPDAAVAAFDKALQRMPAAGELFAILSAQKALLGLFADVLGSAPRLAETVTLHPHVLDAAIDPDATVCLDEEAMAARAGPVLARAATTEDFLDLLRDFKREEHFLIAIRLLSGDLRPEQAGEAYSALAVAIIRGVLDHLDAIFAADHGRRPGAALAIVAMGKLGSREMTATSDLDLVLIHEFDADHAMTDGARPIHASTYVTRLTQRLVSYLSVATRRGGLYDVDMRLRPSGNQGPIATKLSAFKAYQLTTAQTWERMALTRARVIAGDPAFCARVSAEIGAILRTPAGPELATDVAAMRALVAREKPPAHAWDFKLLPGGLLDIEFIAQYLALRDGAAHPDLLDPSTRAILEAATTLGVIDADTGAGLLAAHRLYANTTQIMRLALGDGQAPEKAGKAVKARLAAAVDLPSFTRLKDEIAAARRAVRDSLDALLPRP